MAAAKELTQAEIAADIWDTLSGVDVSERVEKKNNLSYLSWAWAWGVLMKHYPDARYAFREHEVLPNGEIICHVDMDIRGVKRHMWLPVMNHVNKPIPNPNGFEINKTMMRCLTKCIAMYGLGHYIYAGEDVPEESTEQRQEREAAEAKAKAAEAEAAKAQEALDSAREHLKTIILSCKNDGIETPDELKKRAQKAYKGTDTEAILGVITEFMELTGESE